MLRGRAVQAFQRPRAWVAPTQRIRRWRAGVVAFAEHAALALAVDPWMNCKNPQMVPRLHFLTHRMRPGSCWRRNKNPRNVARPYFLTHRMRPGSCCLGKQLNPLNILFFFNFSR